MAPTLSLRCCNMIASGGQHGLRAMAKGSRETRGRILVHRQTHMVDRAGVPVVTVFPVRQLTPISGYKWPGWCFWVKAQDKDRFVMSFVFGFVSW